MRLFLLYKIVYFIILTAVLSTIVFLGLFTYRDLYLSIDETVILVNLRSELAITESLDLPSLAGIKHILEKKIFIETLNTRNLTSVFTRIKAETE